MPNECSASCENLQFEYDYKSDKLAITRPVCNALACSFLSDDEVIKLIKPHVMKHSAQRIDLAAIQTRFEDAESSDSSLQAYMCGSNMCELKEK